MWLQLSVDYSVRLVITLRIIPALSDLSVKITFCTYRKQNATRMARLYSTLFFSQVLEWFIFYTYRVISPLFEYFKLFRLRVFSYLCVFCFSLHCASSSLLASSLKSKGSLNSSPSSSSLKTPDSDPGKEATGKEEEVDIEEPDSLPPGPPAVRSAPYQVCIGPPSVSALCLYVHEGGVSFIHSIQPSAVLVWAAW